MAALSDVGLPRVRTPWSIGRLLLPHRIVMGSMHTGLETRDDGGLALGAFYRERVEGGASLIITGGLAVSSVARGGPDYAVLGEPDLHKRLSVAVAAVHAAGGRIAAQLFHAGRYAIIDGESVAPSAVPWRAARGAVPRALTDAEIQATIADFATAAAAATSAGFDAVEIMASEGYLINQFCSPLTNLRDDEWGGDAERRRRFAAAVVGAVREAIPASVPVLVRMSGDDLMPGSSTPDEVDALAIALVEAGADALSIGMGWHESTVPTVQASVPHGAWLGYAERIRAAVSGRVPVIASNRITDLREAEKALERGGVDAIALARPFLADPRIIERSFAGDFGLVNTCIGCDQACIDRSLVFEPVSCLVNPRAGRESEFPITMDEGADRSRRRFAVVGAGPAGLAAALDLAERGHRVTLFEAADALGGQFSLAARIPGKEDYARTPASALQRLQQLGAEIRTGVQATLETVSDFDGVVLATGVVPREVDIPGADLPHVLSYERAITAGVPAGTVAIIGGGGIGVDVAAYLVESHDPRERAAAFMSRFDLTCSSALLDERSTDNVATVVPRPGSTVTLLRRQGRFGHGVGITTRWVAIGALREAGVRMVSDVSYRAITAEGVEVEHPDGRVELIPGESVIVCAGQERHDPLAYALDGAGIPFRVVGGARDARSVDAVRATTEGLEAARRLAQTLGD